MSSLEKNLSEVNLPALEDPHKIKIGIVRSKWNDEITSKLLSGAIALLAKADIPSENISCIDVPGSYELPMGAKILLANSKADAIVCLGCVIKGETDHDKFINQAVANGLMQLSLITGTPCIFGLLTVHDRQQALDRAGGTHGNKGIEAAATALTMIDLKKKSSDKKSIGF
jgi:6,7-dimethyl-8-ribityllumazine synthase